MSPPINHFHFLNSTSNITGRPVPTESHRTVQRLERQTAGLEAWLCPPSWVTGLDPAVLVCQVETPLPPTPWSSPGTRQGNSHRAWRKREPFSVTSSSHFQSAGQYCQLRFLSQCLKGSQFPLPPPQCQRPIPPRPTARRASSRPLSTLWPERSLSTTHLIVSALNSSQLNPNAPGQSENTCTLLYKAMAFHLLLLHVCV